MKSLTNLLNAVGRGENGAADQLMNLVYEDLRRVAEQKMAQEPVGLTLDAAGLVNEAYLRLFPPSKQVEWENRRHFFGAAAEAMRRVLIEGARKRKRLKRGGLRQRINLTDLANLPDNTDLVLSIDDCLVRLQAEDPQACEVARLRLFAGLSVDSVADVLGFSRATAYRHWTYARAWLQAELQKD